MIRFMHDRIIHMSQLILNELVPCIIQATALISLASLGLNLKYEKNVLLRMHK